HGLRGTGDRETVRRYAFVEDHLLENDEHVHLQEDLDFTPRMMKMVGDEIVRGFESVEELHQFSQGKTDYIGTVAEKDDLWVRFAPEGLNILGETHGFLPMRYITDAVGSKNFIHEAFTAVEDLGFPMPRTQNTVDEIAMIRHLEFGTEKEPDKGRFAAESFLPKMGFAINRLERYLPKYEGRDFAQIPETLDDALLKGMKMAYTFVDELATRIPQNERSPELGQLLSYYEDNEGPIRGFVESLVIGEKMGLTKAATAASKSEYGTIEILLTFSLSLMEYLRKTLVDMTPGYEFPEAKLLADQAAKKQLHIQYEQTHEREVFYRDLRDRKFLESVREARQRGVRYAGMGNNHLLALQEEGIEQFGHPYDMRENGEEYKGFRTATDAMKQAAAKQEAEKLQP
ncbi:MAG: hypothetical protein MI919_06495, partial [Holophagales bacterium]|nr:hypothetical protein [Holophagales bacterium]